MKQKGFTPILILILIALGVAGYFGYKYYKSTTKTYYPPATPIPLTDGEKPGWKKYTHPVTNYSIEFPTDSWEIETHGFANGIYYPTSISLDCKGCNDKNNHISIFKPVNESNISERKKWLNDTFGNSINDTRVVTITEGKLNGYLSITDFNPKSSQAPSSYNIFITNGSESSLIQTSEKPTKGSAADQIISTFRFTK